MATSAAFVRIQLSDLVPREGEPDASYVAAATQLTEALRNDQVCILQFAPEETLVLKNSLSYASGIFEKGRKGELPEKESKAKKGEVQKGERSTDDDVGGYHELPEKEIYKVMLGERPHDPPLVDSFRLLSEAARRVLRALALTLQVDTWLFEPLLDSAPLRPRSRTTSLLSYFRYKEAAVVKDEEGTDGNYVVLKHIDQGLLTIVTSDQPGLEILTNGAWRLVDADLADNELVLFPGQALAEATAGLFLPAEHRVSGRRERLSAAFKCRPRLDATFDRGAIFAAHPDVGVTYAGVQRFLHVAAYVADLNARFESVKDLKVRKEETDDDQYVDSAGAGCFAWLAEMDKTNATKGGLTDTKPMKVEVGDTKPMKGTADTMKVEEINAMEVDEIKAMEVESDETDAPEVIPLRRSTREKRPPSLPPVSQVRVRRVKTVRPRVESYVPEPYMPQRRD